MPFETIELSRDGSIARVVLARPDVRNAFNAPLIAELTQVFAALNDDGGVRAIVLSGKGPTFCGGADVNWMRASLELSQDENVADARRMSDMFRTIDTCAKPVIAQIHGAALGGGAGLAAVCDIAIADDATLFGFTEVKLGIIPAVISPFVLAKIGTSQARALFVTGERFGARRAQAIGLVHEIAAPGALDAAVGRVLEELRSAGPSATAAAKTIVARVRGLSYDDARDITTQAIAQQRTSPEGQAGLRAFLERRTAPWAE